MKFLRHLGAVFFLAILSWGAPSTLAAALPEAEIRALAEEAYVFGYPLVLMDASREAPNQFYHQRQFPDPSSKGIVNPNVDTLESSAWLDLSKGPVVLSVPAANFRYYLLSMHSGWSEVFTSLSPRTSTTAQADFAIVGPGWNGTLPEGLRRIDAPTQMAWIFGRTQLSGKNDTYATVHQFQDAYRLTPLSEWGKAEASSPVALAPAKPAARKTVASMKAQVFFAKLAELMKANPPAAADAPMLAKLAQLGIVPGQPFDVAALGSKSGKALQQGAKAGLAKLIAEAKGKIGKVENGWVTTRDLGSYGGKYLFRAAMAWLDLGADLPNDLLIPTLVLDSEGKPLNGANRYVLHFEKGEFPPGMGFWSVTMYDERGKLVANPILRHAIVDSDPLKTNADGSLDLYIQKDSPGADKESNWLPSPAKSFKLMMRIYYPMQKMLDGTWLPPPVKRLP
jgi:hypothetical protein